MFMADSNMKLFRERVKAVEEAEISTQKRDHFYHFISTTSVEEVLTFQIERIYPEIQKALKIDGHNGFQIKQLIKEFLPVSHFIRIFIKRIFLCLFFAPKQKRDFSV